MKICNYIFMLLLLSCNSNDKIWYRKWEFSGQIIKKYDDSYNHNLNTFMVVEKDSTFKILPYDWPNMWDYACEGDSIIKPKDTLLIIIKKPYFEEQKFFYAY